MSEEGKIKRQRGFGHGALTGLGALPDPSKRKFNVAKVAGSATNLQFISDDDRGFEERRLR